MAPDTLTPCKIRAPSASSEVLKLLATLDPARSVSVTAAVDGARTLAGHHASILSWSLIWLFRDRIGSSANGPRTASR